MVKHKLHSNNQVKNISDNTGKLVANITKWWDRPNQKPNECEKCFGCMCTEVHAPRHPNAYVIDVYNENMSGENRLGAIQKTALIGATLLIEFAFYLPVPQAKNRDNMGSQ